MGLQIVDLYRYTTLNLGTVDDAYIAAGAVLEVTTGTGVFGGGSNHRIVIAGHVSASQDGVYFNGGSSNRVEVSAGGAVFGDFSGVALWALGSSVSNQGLIGGNSNGVQFANSTPGAIATLSNSGTIIGNIGVNHFNTASSAVINVYNTGTIIGFSSSFLAYDDTFLDPISVDRIFNKGLMDGNIIFALGNDLYDGRGGTLKGTAFGGAGNDVFYGGNGVERFDGGADIDTFIGGLGKDNLTLGAGADKVRYNAATEGGDVIADFTTADFFQFKKAAFGNLALGTLSSTAYWENTTGAAHDASDRFIFETDLSRLWYDKDGTGSAAKVLIADMVAFVNISNTDIQIV